MKNNIVIIIAFMSSISLIHAMKIMKKEIKISNIFNKTYFSSKHQNNLFIKRSYSNDDDADNSYVKGLKEKKYFSIWRPKSNSSDRNELSRVFNPKTLASLKIKKENDLMAEDKKVDSTFLRL